MKVFEILYEQVEWRTIPGWPEYEVSNAGEIRSKKTGNSISSWKHHARRGTYDRITLRRNPGDKGRKRFNIRAHRAVALAFLPVPKRLKGKGRLEVDHKDGNSHNNHVSNLEWVSGQENTQRAKTRQKERGHPKKIKEK
jgi:hypothetical protein